MKARMQLRKIRKWRSVLFRRMYIYIRERDIALRLVFSETLKSHWTKKSHTRFRRRFNLDAEGIPAASVIPSHILIYSNYVHTLNRIFYLHVFFLLLLLLLNWTLDGLRFDGRVLYFPGDFVQNWAQLVLQLILAQVDVGGDE